jgi:hypothetical protein
VHITRLRAFCIRLYNLILSLLSKIGQALAQAGGVRICGAPIFCHFPIYNIPYHLTSTGFALIYRVRVSTNGAALSGESYTTYQDEWNTSLGGLDTTRFGSNGSKLDQSGMKAVKVRYSRSFLPTLPASGASAISYQCYCTTLGPSYHTQLILCASRDICTIVLRGSRSVDIYFEQALLIAVGSPYDQRWKRLLESSHIRMMLHEYMAVNDESIQSAALQCSECGSWCIPAQHCCIFLRRTHQMKVSCAWKIRSFYSASIQLCGLVPSPEIFWFM